MTMKDEWENPPAVVASEMEIAIPRVTLTPNQAKLLLRLAHSPETICHSWTSEDMTSLAALGLIEKVGVRREPAVKAAMKKKLAAALRTHAKAMKEKNFAEAMEALEEMVDVTKDLDKKNWQVTAKGRELVERAKAAVAMKVRK